MRGKLKEYLGEWVIGEAKIEKFGNMRFDGEGLIKNGQLNLDYYNSEEFNSEPPKSIKSEFKIDPIEFKTKTTLLTNIRINDVEVTDHIWIPEDLSKKGFKEMEEIKFAGIVKEYTRKDKSKDYVCAAKIFKNV